jgi:hypothetical protein
MRRQLASMVVALLAALSLLGVGYASWIGQNHVQGTVHMAGFDYVFDSVDVLDFTAPPPYSGVGVVGDYTLVHGHRTQTTQNIGWGSAQIEPGSGNHLVSFALNNAYPGYFNHLDMTVANSGSIPMVVDGVVFSWAGGSKTYRSEGQVKPTDVDLNGDGKADVELIWGDNFGATLQPDATCDMGLGVLILPDAPQGAHMDFGVQLNTVQANEYVPPSP